MKHSLLILLLSFLIFNCSSAPRKPSDVPSDAVYIEGEDGSGFLQCNQNPAYPKTYHCVIYNDSNGEVWSEGIWAVYCGDFYFNSNDKEIYISYELGRILLRDGRYLVKIQPENVEKYNCGIAL